MRAIELIDELVVGTLLDGMEGRGDYRILILPDHPTPLAVRTHTRDAVPFLIYERGKPRDSGLERYDEDEAKKSGLYVDPGHELMARFLGGA